MKKSVEILAHLFLWIGFTLLIITFCKLYLQAKPDIPAAQYVPRIIFMELALGIIFFYTTFIGMPWARKSPVNLVILSVILLFLLLVFAYPAISHGSLQVLSSVVPHLMIIFLAVIFRRISDLYRLDKQQSN
jgi:cell division protein FtsW (lipid II flippase)